VTHRPSSISRTGGNTPREPHARPAVTTHTRAATGAMLWSSRLGGLDSRTPNNVRDALAIITCTVERTNLNGPGESGDFSS
jgi:hypothetical protein